MPLIEEQGSDNRQRWARVPPGLAWKRPGLPRDWVRALDRHPDPLGLANDGYPVAGYVWLETPAKVLSVAEHLLEFTEERRP
jgi:hypothetical protein